MGCSPQMNDEVEHMNTQKDPLRIVSRIAAIQRRAVYTGMTAAMERAVRRYWFAWHIEVTA